MQAPPAGLIRTEHLTGEASSFVIITRNRPKELMWCLESVRSQEVRPGEVVIVDAGSDDGLRADAVNLLASAGIRPVYLRSLPGTSRQRNLGVRHATGGLIFFLDDDVVLEADYHREMLNAYRGLSDVPIGGVQGTIKNVGPLSRWELIIRRIFLLRQPVNRGPARILPSGHFTWCERPQDIIEVESMSTCCCSYPAWIFREFQFDESFDGYGFKEDVDLAYRVSRRFRLFQTPHARLLHLRSSVGRLERRRKNAERVANTIYLWRKNLPHTPQHLLALIWSLIGTIVLTSAQSLSRRNLDPLIGAFEGFLSIPRLRAADGWRTSVAPADHRLPPV